MKTLETESTLDRCPRCAIVGRYTGRESAFGKVAIAYACDAGHAWNHNVKRGDVRIPPASAERKPRPAPASRRCVVHECGRPICAPAVFCFAHTMTPGRPPIMADGTNV